MQTIKKTVRIIKRTFKTITDAVEIDIVEVIVKEEQAEPRVKCVYRNNE